MSDVVVVVDKHEFSKRRSADYNRVQNHVILHGVCVTCRDKVDITFLGANGISHRRRFNRTLS